MTAGVKVPDCCTQNPTENDKIWTFLSTYTVINLRDLSRTLRTQRKLRRSDMVQSIYAAAMHIRSSQSTSDFDTIIPGIGEWLSHNAV